MIRTVKDFRNERGSALVLCLAILGLLGVLGAITAKSTVSELRAAGNQKITLQSFAAAESGISEAMRRLKEDLASNDYAGDPIDSHNPYWAAYILTDDIWESSNDPTFDDRLANYIPVPGNAENTEVLANSKQQDISYSVRIRHKREYDAEKSGHTINYPHYVDDDGIQESNTDESQGNVVYFGYGDISQPTTAVPFTTSEPTRFHPVEIITSYGKSANVTKVIEVEVVRNPGLPILGAMYSKGDFYGNGKATDIAGYDYCGVDSDKSAVYTLDPAVTDIGNANVHGDIDSGTQDLDLDAFIDNLKKATTLHETLTNDVSGASFGAVDNHVVVYSNTLGNVGGLKMMDVDGYGTLIVDGDLTLGGGFTWTGLVVVNGSLTFNGGGAGVNIFGAVMSGDVTNLNGGLNIQYDSCAVNDALGHLNYEIINWRQIK